MLDVLLVLEIARCTISTRSQHAIHAKRFHDDHVGRQRSPTDQIATLDEQREFARGQPHDRLVLAPQRREPPFLETLLENAETGAVP